MIQLRKPEPQGFKQGEVLYVEQHDTWGITDTWELSHSAPNMIGWFKTEDDTSFQPVTVKDVLALPSMNGAQASRILTLTFSTVEKLLRAYMERDASVFDEETHPVVTEDDWDEAARQIEVLRRQWREAVT